MKTTINASNDDHVIMDLPVNANAAKSDSSSSPGGATAALHKILGELRLAAGGNGSASTSNADASLGDVIDRLDERAYGVLLLLLALPCCLPFIYLLPQIVALPMLALAGQMAMGREHPWLPEQLHERKFRLASFEGVLVRGEKYIGWFEKLSRPRLTAITDHGGAKIVGALLLVPTASILLPLPSTNTVPGIGVAIASIGLIERDGVLVILGLLMGFAWVALLAFFGLEAASLIKDWLSARL